MTLDLDRPPPAGGEFDRQWQLAELLTPATLQRLAPNLRALLGADAAIVDAAGQALLGTPLPGGKREPLVLELEPVGYLVAGDASPEHLGAARGLLETLLRAEMRFKMASTLHLEAVAEDFETLKRAHARLQESESRYRKLAEELDARVKQQVAQLEERQQMLYQAEKMASVGQLAAGMAHEINNPLGFIRSNLSTLADYLRDIAGLRHHLADVDSFWREKDLDFVIGDGQALIHECLDGFGRIARIIADLKSFSNVDRATEEHADLNTCVRHAAAMFGQLPDGIDIALDLEPLPRLVCLPGHINQLLYSLIRNGIQAIEDAGRSGRVDIASRTDDAGITLTVRDNGVGMTAEQLDRAFEPFYTTRKVGAGAGLGLSTARNIVLAHSGRIELASQPLVGTQVTIFFPLPK